MRSRSQQSLLKDLKRRENDFARLAQANPDSHWYFSLRQAILKEQILLLKEEIKKKEADFCQQNSKDFRYPSLLYEVPTFSAFATAGRKIVKD